MSNSDQVANQIVNAARSIFDRGLTHGRTGNLSARVDAGILVTPTGSSLGTVREEELSLIDDKGNHIGGAKPSKEAFLHAAVLRARPSAQAIVHTHSTYSAAVSCLADVDPADVLPALTAYYAMRVARLPLLPYFAPGDRGLEPVAEKAATQNVAILLRNHGPVVAGSTLDSALDALEELEETAKLHLLLRGHSVSPVPEDERRRLLSSQP